MAEVHAPVARAIDPVPAPRFHEAQAGEMEDGYLPEDARDEGVRSHGSCQEPGPASGQGGSAPDLVERLAHGAQVPSRLQ